MVTLIGIQGLGETGRITGLGPAKEFSPGHEAAKALGKIGGPAVEPLIAALKEGSQDARFQATLALGMIKDARAIAPLIAAMKDKYYGVRANVALALGMIKDFRTVEPLIDALKDKESLVRSLARNALRKITEQNYAEDPVKWQEWWEKNKPK